MNAKLPFSALALAAGIFSSSGQGVGVGVILTGGLGPGTTPTAPVSTTVVYQAPVVFQTPVVYRAPMVYQTPVYSVPAYTALAGGYYNPNVIYFGGPNSCYRNYYSACSYSPNVLYFGRGQSYYQGYNFTRCR